MDSFFKHFPSFRWPISATRSSHPSLRGGLDWTVIIGLGWLHVVAIAAPWTFTWSGLAWLLVLWYLTGGLGIVLCYHRLLTHRSFACPRWLEYTLTFLACAAWQGRPSHWVGTHRIHHKHSDDEGDPHTPQHGFTWSHIFWTMFKEPEGMKADDFAKDLQRDAGMRWFDKWFVVPQFIIALFLIALGYALGGTELAISWFVWGVALRTVWVWHVTWFVNSATHTWGYRNFKTGEHSTNLWWVAILSFGEGWHNNHHAHPRSATHGMRWFEIDPTNWLIALLEATGLAWNVKRTTL
ncbi:acyl-CoA desaturase [Mucisphaera calidilacus]|uniref:Fatty acid desaturase n=1 Tax=Mucisphaera calidilacus TaxID=2527982 RepID=A0A518C022_9BACT|nr:fatty acid desaturase [Mucisphaera calidilacus]QDU72574.1 Fatty acid desaturase [Mucisphaera calidilacus]